MTHGSRQYNALWTVCAFGPGVVLYLVHAPWWLWTAIYVFLAVVFVVYLLVSGKRHRRRLAEWAAQHGWAMGASPSARADISTHAPFGKGNRNSIHDVLYSPVEPSGGQWRVTSFTYRWWTVDDRERQAGSSGSENAKDYHVIAVELPRSLPWLEVVPEGIAAKTISTIGGQDIQLESSDFNRAFRILADSDRFAHDILHPRLMEFLLTQPMRGFHWRIEGNHLLWWQQGVTVVDRIEPVSNALVQIASSIPAYVWSARPSDPLPW